MRIIQKTDISEYVVEAREWEALVSKYGREGAAKLVKSGDWILASEHIDEFDLYATLTFQKQVVPHAETSLRKVS